MARGYRQQRRRMGGGSGESGARDEEERHRINCTSAHFPLFVRRPVEMRGLERWIEDG